MANPMSSVSYPKPSSLVVNEERRSEYAGSQKIETLIQELKEKGPMVALGQMGPVAYLEHCVKFNEMMHGQPIYGWISGSTRTKKGMQTPVIILGAKKEGEKELVYYTLSEDITPNSTEYARKHRPLNTDTKIYAASHKTFKSYLFDIYPPVAAEAAEKTVPGLSASQMEYVKKLSAIMPLDAILDKGEIEQSCNAMGQEIFDRYKQEAGGSTEAGKGAAKKICEAVCEYAPDGKLRKQYIEYAWNGIGDSVWDWRA